MFDYSCCDFCPCDDPDFCVNCQDKKLEREMLQRIAAMNDDINRSGGDE